MRSSHILSLFSERPEVSQRPSSFIVSILAHVAAVILLAFGIVYTPEIRDPVLKDRYSVRHLDLHATVPKPRPRAGKEFAYPGPHPDVHAASSGGSEAALKEIAEAEPGPQTLIQPDLPARVKIKEKIPVPTVVIWSPKKDVVKTVVPPLPEKATAADVQPASDPPNEEVNLADLSISATSMLAQTRAIFPSTTSPVVIHGPDKVQLPPASTSQSTAEPTPAAVMSLSDIQMQSGTVSLPPVNERASAASQGTLAPGSSANSPQAGSGNPESAAGGIGSGPNPGSPGDANSAAGKQTDAKSGSGPSGAAGPGSGDQASTDQITLPKDGQFGAVVVGATLEEKFPQAAQVWRGRMAYTVYLHVGLSKSWILQYSLPSAEDAALAGNISRLEAPWPYNIVRPNLSPEAMSADALMVHGFVNQQGRFERLAVAFPPEFEQAQFVLDALQQWQFRPAVQNGQNERVEVVLIIPEELD
jgi:hypothetical protein